MELRHLRTFIVAAQLESFTKASQSLGMTQGAVSQQVAALEKQLEASLFERVGRVVKLTDQGRQLDDYARKIVDLVDQAERAIRNESAAINGTLRIATSTVPAESLLPELLAEFRQMYPDVNEAVSVSDSAEATQAVENGDADVGFIGELPQQSPLTAKPIADDELAMIVAPSHRYVEKGSIAINELRTEPMIIREPGSASRHCVEKGLEARGIRLTELTIGIEMNSNEAIRVAVQRGAGIGFLSKRAIANDVAGGTLAIVKVRGLKLQRKLYVITDKQRVASSPLREFLAFLEKRSA